MSRSQTGNDAVISSASSSISSSWEFPFLNGRSSLVRRRSIPRILGVIGILSALLVGRIVGF